MSIEIPDQLLDALADRLADRLAARLDLLHQDAGTPWFDKNEAIAYTKMAKGTFEKWVQDGRIKAHGGRRQLFHRDELDRALGYAPPPSKPGLRSVSDAA